MGAYQFRRSQSIRRWAYFRDVWLPLVVVWLTGISAAGSSQVIWQGLGANPQHAGVSTVGARHLDRIIWKMPVDLAPQYQGGDLFIHYGSPVITSANTVVVPVKTGASFMRALQQVTVSADTLREVEKVVRNRKKNPLKHPKL